jgi:hypothetical protein
MAENLKNTLLINGIEYNINAVHSEFADEATKTKASLTLTKSLSTGDDKSQIFDGENNEEIKYVPASGGKFTGPVLIDANLDDVDQSDINKAIINYGQITSKIADLTGAPLYTLDDNYQIRSVTDANQTDYKLNTLVGTSHGLKVLKSILVDGSEGIKYRYEEATNTYTVVGLDDTYDHNVVIPAIYKDPATNIRALVTKIGNGATDYANGGAFAGTTITSVVLPDSIEVIEKWTFKECRDLISVNIPDKVSVIYENTFYGCSSLKNIKFGNGIKQIGQSAFSGCANIGSVVFPEGITNISSLAFNGCAKLASVVIPKSVTTLGENVFNATNNPVALTIYYTGTASEWSSLMAKITSANVRLKEATVQYNYKISNDNSELPDIASIANNIIDDLKAFGTNPILYICKDQETAGSPVSNKMFLKLPGNNADFIEISKGAARLESQIGATTSGYYTYETLAAIIAGINARLAALGGDSLKLPTTLPETDSVIIPADLHTEILGDTFSSTNVITLQGLQDAINALAGTEGETGNGESLSKLREDLDDVIDDLEELAKEVNIELNGQENNTNLNGRLTTVETYIAETLPNVLSGKAAASHGTHVPTTETADNATFLRNDNTWQKVTPVNIGAAAAHDHPYLASSTNYAGSSSQGGAANSVANYLTVKLNSGTTEGTSLFTFDGSAAKTVNITPANIGAAAAHDHPYLASSTNYAGSSSQGGAASSVANSLTIQLNNGGTEGTNQFTFNGNEGKTVNITPANIGAAAAHDHPYLASSTNYAGSSSQGGAATSAEKLSNTSAIGNATIPVYFSAEGVPVACTSLSLDTTGNAATANSATTAGTAGALHDTTNTANSYTYSSIKEEFDGIKNGTTALTNVVINNNGILTIGNTTLNEKQLQKILNFIDSIELV